MNYNKLYFVIAVIVISFSQSQIKIETLFCNPNTPDCHLNIKKPDNVTINENYGEINFDVYGFKLGMTEKDFLRKIKSAMKDSSQEINKPYSRTNTEIFGKNVDILRYLYFSNSYKYNFDYFYQISDIEFIDIRNKKDTNFLLPGINNLLYKFKIKIKASYLGYENEDMKEIFESIITEYKKLFLFDSKQPSISNIDGVDAGISWMFETIPRLEHITPNKSGKFVLIDGEKVDMRIIVKLCGNKQSYDCTEGDEGDINITYMHKGLLDYYSK